MRDITYENISVVMYIYDKNIVKILHIPKSTPGIPHKPGSGAAWINGHIAYTEIVDGFNFLLRTNYWNVKSDCHTRLSCISFSLENKF